MLFGLWPTCARKDCGSPGFVKFEFEDAGEVVEAWLCIPCMQKTPELFAEVSKTRAATELLEGPEEKPEGLPDGT